jgi:hypothetical protein
MIIAGNALAAGLRHRLVAAVNAEDLAGHVAVGHQVKRAQGAFLGGADAADRQPVSEPVASGTIEVASRRRPSPPPRPPSPGRGRGRSRSPPWR